MAYRSKAFGIVSKLFAEHSRQCADLQKKVQQLWQLCDAHERTPEMEKLIDDTLLEVHKEVGALKALTEVMKNFIENDIKD